MKKSIKFLSAILVFTLMIGTFCVSAYYVDGLYIEPEIKNNGIWFYELIENNKTAKIYGYMGNENDVVIPEFVEEKYAVTELVLNSPYMRRAKFPIFGTQANFETLTIPKSLKLISNYFSREYYEEVGYSKTFREIKEGKLEYNGQVIMKGFFDCQPLHNLKAFIVDEENQYFSSKDGVLYSKDRSILIQYPWGKSEKKFEIPNTVTAIMPYAISGYKNIKEIIITENVKKLGAACISDAITYHKISNTTFDSYLSIPDIENRAYVKILNNNLGKEQLASLFDAPIGESKFKLTVYKNSPADKYFSDLSVKSKYTVTEIVERLENPYIKKEPEKEEKEKNSSKSVSSKNTSSKNTSSKTNQSPAPDTTESVVSKPEKTEETTESQVLTIGATESETTTENKNETKPEKSSNLWIIIAIAAAVVILAGGGTAYWFIRKKKKV